MSTTTRTSRGKPVTLAKSASAELPVRSASKTKTAKTPAPKDKAPTPVPDAPVSHTSAPQAPVLHSDQALSDAVDAAFPAKLNDLVKAQSEAALAWWQDAKDARTLADALAINAKHSRVQFELAAGQARELAAYFQKTFEGNAERVRALFTPTTH